MKKEAIVENLNRLKELFRSLDPDDLNLTTMESIDEILVEMGVDELEKRTGGNPSKVCKDGGVVEQIANKFGGLKSAGKPAWERLSIIDEILKLLCKSSGR